MIPLSAKGLLDEGGMRDKLQTMRRQANNHQTKLEELIPDLESEGLTSENIEHTAEETEQKATEMMKTYLGEDPDSSEAIEFLCLAEGGEITHYEVLSAMAKGVKNKKFGAKVKAILAEGEKTSPTLARLAKQIGTSA